MFQEQLEYMNGPIPIKDILSVLINILIKKTPGTGNSTGKFYQIFKKDIYQFYTNYARVYQKREHSLTKFVGLIYIVSPNLMRWTWEKKLQANLSNGLISLRLKILNKILGSWMKQCIKKTKEKQNHVKKSKLGIILSKIKNFHR